MYIQINKRLYRITEALNKKQGYSSIQDIRTKMYLVYSDNKLVNKVFRYDDEYVSNASFINSGSSSFRLENGKYLTNDPNVFSDTEYKFETIEGKRQEIQHVITNIDNLEKELTNLLNKIYNYTINETMENLKNEKTNIS